MFVALFAVNVLVLSLWTALNPAEWERKTTSKDEFGRPSESLGYCSYKGSLPYLIVLAVIDMGALIYACYEAYVARDLSTEYAESEYIFKAMATVLLVLFIAIPVAILARENATVYNCVTAGLIFVVCLSFLLLIFVPKIQFHRKKEIEAQESARTARRRRSEVWSSQCTSFDESRVSDEECHEEFGSKVYNRRQMQEELEAENKRLNKVKKRLELRIAMFENKNGKKGRRSSRLKSEITTDSRLLSSQESEITIDPMEHDDETHMAVAPF